MKKYQPKFKFIESGLGREIKAPLVLDRGGILRMYYPSPDTYVQAVKNWLEPDYSAIDKRREIQYEAQFSQSVSRGIDELYSDTTIISLSETEKAYIDSLPRLFAEMVSNYFSCMKKLHYETMIADQIAIENELYSNDLIFDVKLEDDDYPLVEFHASINLKSLSTIRNRKNSPLSFNHKQRRSKKQNLRSKQDDRRIKIHSMSEYTDSMSDDDDDYDDYNDYYDYYGSYDY